MMTKTGHYCHTKTTLIQRKGLLNGLGWIHSIGAAIYTEYIIVW